MKRNTRSSTSRQDVQNKRAKSIVPELDPDQDVENFPEVVKFHRITKGANQSMESFYHALKAQAAKCSNRFYDDQIRGRIIQAAKDEDLVAFLAQLSNPTAENVLRECHAFERRVKVFPLVLQYLSLPDIRSLSQATRQLEGIVADYIQEGGNIRIDDNLLRDFPIQSNQELYNFFKQATNITFYRVTGEQIGQLKFLLFRNCSQLTLRNMEITNHLTDTDLPKSLTKLALVDLKIEEDSLRNWLYKLHFTLMHLHLIRVETDANEDTTLDLRLCVNKIQTLEIRGMKRVRLGGPTCRELRSLYCDAPQISFYPYETLSRLFPNVHSLTLNHWPNCCELSELKQLDHLKIHRSIDQALKEEVEGRSRPIKSTDLHFDDFTPEEPNLIFNTLNEHCLLKLLEYLPAIDCLSFAKTDKEVYKLVTRNRFSSLKIDPFISSELAENETFLKAIAPFVKHLEIDRCDAFVWLIPYCKKKLTSLSLWGINGLTPEIIATFSRNLKSFTYCQTSPTLAPQYLNQYLSHLRGLRELIVDTSVDPIPCLLSNRDSLVHFKVLLHKKGSSISNDVWDLMADDMPKFTELGIENPTYERSEQEQDHLHFIFSRVGHKLLKLAIHKLPLTGVICGFLKNLQELTLVQNDAGLSLDIKSLCSLKELCVLRIRKYYYIEGDILKIVRELPKLTVFQVQDFKIPFCFARVLQETLSQMGGRQLSLETEWKGHKIFL